MHEAARWHDGVPVTTTDVSFSLNMPADGRFLYWDKFGRADDSAAVFEYLEGGLARVIDGWWVKDIEPESPANGAVP